jgi:hypothetical protein
MVTGKASTLKAKAQMDIKKRNGWCEWAVVRMEFLRIGGVMAGFRWEGREVTAH